MRSRPPLPAASPSPQGGPQTSPPAVARCPPPVTGDCRKHFKEEKVCIPTPLSTDRPLEKKCGANTSRLVDSGSIDWLNMRRLQERGGLTNIQKGGIGLGYKWQRGDTRKSRNKCSSWRKECQRNGSFSPIQMFVFGSVWSSIKTKQSKKIEGKRQRIIKRGYPNG